MKNSIKEKNRKKGVSLIALTVTIVIIVVLSLTIILSVVNNNPIENAKEAVNVSNEATFEEAAKMAYASIYSNKKITSDFIDYNEIIEEVKDALRKQGFLESDIVRIRASENGMTIKDKEPVIPNGFKHLIGTIETGFVIKNTLDGNEFVWIPVEDFSEFKFEGGYSNGKKQNVSSIEEPYIGNGADSSEKAEYEMMKESVKKYGGFYIGRYEASKKIVNDIEVAQSIANQPPWIDIKWGESMEDLSGGIVEKARQVYQLSENSKTKDPVSTLCYGVQWDAAVKFLETNGYEGIEMDSTGKGNNSGEIINTGSPEHPEYALNNIYDMSGNVWEWTMESGYSKYRVMRGGSRKNSGILYPISSRGFGTLDSSGSTGFRLALYIVI